MCDIIPAVIAAWSRTERTLSVLVSTTVSPEKIFLISDRNDICEDLNSIALLCAAAVITDQSWGHEQVGHAEDGQTARASSDLAAILELADRKSLTLRQVELDVKLRQSLQGHMQRGE